MSKLTTDQITKMWDALNPDNTIEEIAMMEGEHFIGNTHHLETPTVGYYAKNVMDVCLDELDCPLPDGVTREDVTRAVATRIHQICEELGYDHNEPEHTEG